MHVDGRTRVRMRTCTCAATPAAFAGPRGLAAREPRAAVPAIPGAPSSTGAHAGLARRVAIRIKAFSFCFECETNICYSTLAAIVADHAGRVKFEPNQGKPIKTKKTKGPESKQCKPIGKTNKNQKNHVCKQDGAAGGVNMLLMMWLHLAWEIGFCGFFWFSRWFCYGSGSGLWFFWFYLVFPGRAYIFIFQSCPYQCARSAIPGAPSSTGAPAGLARRVAIRIKTADTGCIHVQMQTDACGRTHTRAHANMYVCGDASRACRSTRSRCA